MKEKLDYITNLRFPLIVGVVFDHASVVMPDSVRGDDVPSLLFSMLQVLLKISVPVFFIISGFLFFRNTENFEGKLYVGKLKTRVRTLMVPYVLWTLICLLYSCLKQLPTILHTGDLGCISDMFTWQIFWMYKDCLPLHFSLWYVRDLIVMCLVSPVIWLLIKHLRHVAMLLIFGTFILHDIDYHISFPISIFYFSLGAYLSICRIDIHKIVMKLGWGILLIATIAIGCSVLGNITLTRFSHIVFALCCLGMSCFFTGRYQCKIPQLLTDSVFFVYASHCIMIVMMFNRIFMPIIPNTSLPAWLFLRLFIVGILTVITCTLLFVTLRRLFPKTMSVITGSR